MLIESASLDWEAGRFSDTTHSPGCDDTESDRINWRVLLQRQPRSFLGRDQKKVAKRVPSLQPFYIPDQPDNSKERPQPVDVLRAHEGCRLFPRRRTRQSDTNASLHGVIELVHHPTRLSHPRRQITRSFESVASRRRFHAAAERRVPQKISVSPT